MPLYQPKDKLYLSFTAFGFSVGLTGVTELYLQTPYQLQLPLHFVFMSKPLLLFVVHNIISEDAADRTFQTAG